MRVQDASGSSKSAKKLLSIPSISFHSWQRIGTYQRVVAGSRGKNFRPLLPISRRVLRSDRSNAIGRGGGRNGFDGTGQLGLLQDGGAGTHMEHNFWFVKRMPISAAACTCPDDARPNARLISARAEDQLYTSGFVGGRGGFGHRRGRAAAVERRGSVAGEFGAEAVRIFEARARPPVPPLRRRAVCGSGEAASAAAGQPTRRARRRTRSRRAA